MKKQAVFWLNCMIYLQLGERGDVTDLWRNRTIELAAEQRPEASEGSALRVTKTKAVRAPSSNLIPSADTPFSFKIPASMCPNSSSPSFPTKAALPPSGGVGVVLWHVQKKRWPKKFLGDLGIVLTVAFSL